MAKKQTSYPKNEPGKRRPYWLNEPSKTARFAAAAEPPPGRTNIKTGRITPGNMTTEELAKGGALRGMWSGAGAEDSGSRWIYPCRALVDIVAEAEAAAQVK